MGIGLQTERKVVVVVNTNIESEGKMASITLWQSIDLMPTDTLVLVHDDFQGYALRSKTESGDLYDENSIYDDSGIEWDLWTELPMKPGPKGG